MINQNLDRQQVANGVFAWLRSMNGLKDVQRVAYAYLYRNGLIVVDYDHWFDVLYDDTAGSFEGVESGSICNPDRDPEHQYPVILAEAYQIAFDFIQENNK